MHALTLKPPFGYCVCCLGKTVENRKYIPPPGQLRVGDHFAIHGGKAPDSRREREAIYRVVEALVWDHGDSHELDQLKICIPAAFLDRVFRCTGIVAVCRYGGYVTSLDNPWFTAPYGWVLTDRSVLPRPVPCRGRQKLWRIPEPVLAEVKKQWKPAPVRRKEPVA